MLRRATRAGRASRRRLSPTGRPWARTTGRVGAARCGRGAYERHRLAFQRERGGCEREHPAASEAVFQVTASSPHATTAPQKPLSASSTTRSTSADTQGMVPFFGRRQSPASTSRPYMPVTLAKPAAAWDGRETTGTGARPHRRSRPRPSPACSSSRRPARQRRALRAFPRRPTSHGRPGDVPVRDLVCQLTMRMLIG